MDLEPRMHVDLATALKRPPSRLSHTPERRASVAAILDAQLNLLLIKRAEIPGDPWSGHIAFPGGKVEGSEGPIAAAVRETWEEIGLRLSPETVVGELDEVGTPGALPRMIVRAFVFHVDHFGTFTPEPGEVEAVHTLPLQMLLDNRARGEFPLDWKGQRVILPKVDLPWGTLWGMTLRIIDDLLHRIDGGGLGLERL